MEALRQTALMLILDVKTRWSSTHQMLRMYHQYLVSLHQLIKFILYSGRALNYHKVINDFVAKTKDLQKCKLPPEDWSAIELVCHWLKAFHSATTQMSTMKRSMQQHVERAKAQLHQFYLENYAKVPPPPPATQPAVTE